MVASRRDDGHDDGKGGPEGSNCEFFFLSFPHDQNSAGLRQPSGNSGNRNEEFYGTGNYTNGRRLSHCCYSELLNSIADEIRYERRLKKKLGEDEI